MLTPELYYHIENVIVWLNANQWIFKMILVLYILFIFIIGIKSYTQYLSEHTIKNRYNKNGIENAKRNHIKFHIVSHITILFIICGIWYAVTHI